MPSPQPERRQLQLVGTLTVEDLSRRYLGDLLETVELFRELWPSEECCFAGDGDRRD